MTDIRASIASRDENRTGRCLAGAVAAAIMFLALLAGPGVARAQVGEDVLTSVVKIRAEVPADARTARFLGTRREGNGVVIDSDGLVLTIGYLILESSGAEIVLPGGRAVPATFVAYDHDTGFGLLRATEPLRIKALELGDSAALKLREPVLVAGHGGRAGAIGAYVVSRRVFAGYWEYMVEDAIFTSPPHPNFGGAALIGSDGKLVGIGSLIVPDAVEPNVNFPGNMFVPIDALKPILGDLLSTGRSSVGPRPWLGLYSQEVQGRLFVTRVPSDGPAYKAGVRKGDMVLAVAGKAIGSLADFYRRVWAIGKAGALVPLTILHGNVPTVVKVESIDRYDWLRMKMSY